MQTTIEHKNQLNNAESNDPANFDKLPQDEKDRLLTWIKGALVPVKRGVLNSYYLKHVFESHSGYYVDNGTFKGAMLLVGYKPTDAGRMNWDFPVKLVSVDCAGCWRYFVRAKQCVLAGLFSRKIPLHKVRERCPGPESRRKKMRPIN